MFNYAFADEVATTSGQMSQNSFASFIPLILLFVIFYFFIIRPQTKKHKEQQNLINSAKKGDKVVVAGGLIGKITKVSSDSNILEVEIAKGTQIQALKSSIVSMADDLNKKK